MPYRVRYSPDFDLKIRSGQVCQGDPRARSNSKNETIAYFSKLLSLIDTQIGFFRLYNIFEPSKIRQIWILHHTIHLKSCLSQTDYHTISYSYCFATWSKHHQNVGLKVCTFKNFVIHCLFFCNLPLLLFLTGRVKSLGSTLSLRQDYQSKKW